MRKPGLSNERVKNTTQIKYQACLIGFVGVAAANYGLALLQLDFTLAGEESIVMAAFVLSAAIYGKRLSQRLNAAVMTGWQMAIGGAVLLAGGWLAGGQKWRPSHRRRPL